MNEVFKALADSSRRQLLDGLNAGNGQTLRELCAGLDMSRQSVSKHLALLEAAGLVTTRRQGREKLHYLDSEPINAIADRWISQFNRERVRALADLKTALEPSPMSSTEFAYTTYIKSTPEKVWQGLTDPAFTERYWGVVLETDWRPGSTFSWKQRGITVDHPDQVVLEADPYRRLAYTFHTFTPEFVEMMGLSGELADQVMSERRSKVAFDIEEAGPRVKLTVVHDDFGPDSVVRGLVSRGWPSVVSNLKTLLETGEGLSAFPL